MNTLHVRSVPTDLYDYLKDLAEAHHRSLSAQVISMLRQAAEDEKRRAQQKQRLSSIRSRRFHVAEDAPSSLELLHEDRSR